MVAACGRFAFDPRASAGSASDADPSGDAGPDAPSSVIAMFEAESGHLSGMISIASDPRAHAGAYLLDTASNGIGGDGLATYDFDVPTAGTYYVWARTLSPSSANDSFWIAIDMGAQLDYESSECLFSTNWAWGAGGCSPALQQSFALGAGPHVLAIASREGGSAIDRMIITSDPSFAAKD